MFRKLRDKITEEVQQTSLKLPVSVQHLSQLSPFTGSVGDLSEPSRSPQNSIQDELLVDISEIQPAGDNKDLFSIDEDSGEGSPSNRSEFQNIELTDDNLPPTSSTPQKIVLNQFANHSSFDPSPSEVTTSNQHSFRGRISSECSSISEVSGLFPIYEVPGVSFNLQTQSDLESCGSEWEESSGGLDRLSKDTLYQAYVRMRQRYHKYKGRYSDIVKAYEEKEKETEKLRDVLAKQQDKAMRRVSELREQCSLEQQAKAHLEEELRSDLEEKDHKIEALLTKVRLLQEGYMNEGPFRSPFNSVQEIEKSSEEEERRAASLPLNPVVELQHRGTSPAEECDNVSVGSLGSISTAPTSLESDELIERLKGDIAKHKTLLGRCMDNIKANKERISQLKQEKDLISSQLAERNAYIDAMNLDHAKELESLRATVESSALSMAETKQQLFEELQTKEAEVEHIIKRTEELEALVKEQQEQIEELKNQSEEELEIDIEKQHDGKDEKNIKELENKCAELENLVADLQKSKKDYELILETLNQDKDVETKKSSTEGINELELVLIEADKKHTKFDVEIRQLNEKLAALLSERDQLRNDLDLSLKKSEEFKFEVETLNQKLRNTLEGKNQINLEKSKMSQELDSLLGKNNLLKEENKKLNTQADYNLELLKEEINIEKNKNINLTELLENAKANCDKLIIEKKTEENELKLELIEKEKLRDSLEGRLLNTEMELKKFYKVNNETQSALETNCDKLATLEARNDKLCNQIQELENILKVKNLEIDDLNEKCTVATKSKDDLCNEQLEKLSELFDTQLTKFEDVISTLQALLTVRNKLLSQVQEYSRTCSNFEEQLSEKNIKIQSLKQTSSELVAKLTETESTKLELQLKLSEFQRELSDAEIKISDLKTKLSKSETILAETNDKIAEYESKLSLAIENANINILKYENSNNDLNNEIQNLRDKNNSLNQDCEKRILEIKKLLQTSEDNLTKENQENKILKEKLIENQNLYEHLKVDYQKITENKINDNLNELEILKNQLEENQLHISSLESKLQEKECLTETLNNELETTKMQQEKAINEFSHNVENSKECALKIAREMEKEVEILELKLKEKDYELESLCNNLNALTAENKKLETVLDSKSKDYDNLMTIFKALENDKKLLQTNISSLENDIPLKDQMVCELKMNEKLLKENLIKFENKIISMIEEKKNILKDFEDQTIDYENSLEEKDRKFKNVLIECEKRLENCASQHKVEVDSLKCLIEKLTDEKEELQERLIQLNSLQLQKDNLEKQLDENEAMLNQLEATHKKRCREIEEEWQSKLRCELERIQSEHDFELAEAVTKGQQTHSAQLSEEVEGQRRSLARKDAELAELKDTVDSLMAEMENQKEAEEKLISDLEERHSNAEVELQAINASLEGRVKLLQEQLATTEKQMEDQGQCLEQSNSELRQKIDTLQNELNTLETKLKDTSSSIEERLTKEKEMVLERCAEEQKEVEKRLAEEKSGIEEQLLKEKSEIEQRLLKEKSEIEQRLLKEKSESEERLNKEKETIEERHSKQMKEFEERLIKEKVEIEERLTKEKMLNEERLCKEKSEAEDVLKKEKKELEEHYLKEKSEIMERLTKDKSEIEERLLKEKELLEERLKEAYSQNQETLIKEKATLEEQFQEQMSKLVQRLESSSQRARDYQEQIDEKEKRFCELSSKFDSAQQEKDSLKNECAQRLLEWQDLDQDMNLLLQDGDAHRNDANILKESTTGVQLKIKTLYQVKNEAIRELTSLKANLQTLIEEANEERKKKNELLSKIELLESTNAELSRELQSMTNSAASRDSDVASLEKQLIEEKEKLAKHEENLNEINAVIKEISPHLNQQDPTDLKSILRFLSNQCENLKKQLLEEITNSAEINSELKANLNSVKQSLTDTETENTYMCSKLSESESKLRLLQEEIQAKIVMTKVSETQTEHILITEEGVEEAINQCKVELHKEYESNLQEIRTKYENEQKETGKTFEVKVAETIKQREKEMQKSLDQLYEQWNQEKKEVERLTQVASAAFKSGTDSMDLLKKQVTAQRKELDDLKRNHKKEISELQTLLEVKRRRSRGGNFGEVKLGGALEDAAEFEYLKNILYQYMMGKETQTLSKVLCAVAKFTKEQQRQVVEYEENKQSLLRGEELSSSQADNCEQSHSKSL